MELITGFEPVTSSLPRKCSTDWAIWAIIPFSLQLKNSSQKNHLINNPILNHTLFGAGDGDRTHIISLEGWGSTIELHPPIHTYYPFPTNTCSKASIHSLIWRVIQHSLICQLIITINTQIRFLTKQNHSGGGGRIRTYEGWANRFTVCPLWPLGNPSEKRKQLISSKYRRSIN